MYDKLINISLIFLSKRMREERKEKPVFCSPKIIHPNWSIIFLFLRKCCPDGQRKENMTCTSTQKSLTYFSKVS